MHLKPKVTGHACLRSVFGYAVPEQYKHIYPSFPFDYASGGWVQEFTAFHSIAVNNCFVAAVIMRGPVSPAGSGVNHLASGS